MNKVLERQKSYKRYEKYRKKLKITDYAVAKIADIPRSTFTDWHKGVYEPKTYKMKRIADALGISLSELMGE